VPPASGADDLARLIVTGMGRNSLHLLRFLQAVQAICSALRMRGGGEAKRPLQRRT
jgi:hypothetical protein